MNKNIGLSQEHFSIYCANISQVLIRLDGQPQQILWSFNVGITQHDQRIKYCS